MKFGSIKSNARESLKGKWGVAILAFIIATAFGSTGSSITSSSSEEVDLSMLSQLSTQEILTTLAVFGGAIILGLVVSVILSSLVSIGYAQFNIDLVDGDDPKITTLFSKGKQVGTAIVANLLVFIRVLFGLILFVVPGIIAIYKYSMVNYVIADNPGISAKEALEQSREIMKGNKLRYFLFGLSFIGWCFVAVLTLGIAGLWIAPYINASCAAFYREIA